MAWPNAENVPLPSSFQKVTLKKVKACSRDPCPVTGAHVLSPGHTESSAGANEHPAANTDQERAAVIPVPHASSGISTGSRGTRFNAETTRTLL